MKNQSFSSEDQFPDRDMNAEAREFLFSIMSYYNGSTEEKITRASEFIDDLLFKTEHQLGNPFSNEARIYYTLANYSKIILIPEMINAINTIENSNPIDIHRWN